MVGNTGKWLPYFARASRLLKKALLGSKLGSKDSEAPHTKNGAFIRSVTVTQKIDLNRPHYCTVRERFTGLQGELWIYMIAGMLENLENCRDS